MAEEETAEFQPPTAESTDLEKVEYVLPIIMELCPQPVDMLNLLVPIVAAALEKVGAQPEHVTAFFFRVTGLLDQKDAQPGQPVTGASGDPEVQGGSGTPS